MRIHLSNQICLVVKRCLGLLLGLTIATQAWATDVASHPTTSAATSFTNPCGLTAPVLTPSSTSVLQGAPAVSIIATGCPGGIIQYFNNLGNPAGVYTIAPGGTISVPTNLTGVMLISAACSANGCLSDVATATITIKGSGVAAPPTVANAIPNQSGTLGDNFVYVIPANTFSDPNNDPLTLSVSTLPAGLFFNGGVITGPLSQTGTSTIVVKATNLSNLSASTSFNLTVNPGTPSVNQPPVVVGGGITSPQTATLDAAASIATAFAFSDPEGGPLTFSAGLPPNLGLSINPTTGVISGSPNTKGSYGITVIATDNNGLSISTGFLLTVVLNPNINYPVEVNGTGISTPQTIMKGSPASIPTAYGFSDPEGHPLTFFSSPLPAGLSINPSTGVISGTPTTYGGPFGIAVGATDDGGSTAYSGFFLTITLNPAVNEPPYIVDTGITTPQTTVAGQGFNRPTAYAFADPEGHALTFLSSPLPAGLSLDPGTGVISGTPSVYGTFGITVGATDDGGSTVYSGFFLTISLDPNVNYPPVIVGSGITSPQTITKGLTATIPTAYAFSDPENHPLSYFTSPLPAGLSINPVTGVISGVPTTYGGPFGITVGVTDDGGSTVYGGFFLTIILNPAVNEPPYATGPAVTTPQTGTVGTPLSIQTASGFVDPEGHPLTYTSSPLPGGLTLNTSTGEISGTPSQAGQFGVTIGVTDDGGSTVYNGFFLTIVQPGGGRIGVFGTEIGSELSVSVLGNPVLGETVNVEIRGAANQPISLKTLSAGGNSISETAVGKAGELETVTVRLGQSVGIYFLQVSTPTQQKIIKLLKH